MQKSKKTPKISESLMGIDHADWLFGVLCKIENGKTKSETEELFMIVSKGHIKKRDSKTIEMYRYWLTTLKLLNGLKNKKYTLTHNGKKFCEKYNKQDKTSYQKFLRSILMRNSRVGPFFKKYRKIISIKTKSNNPITRDDSKKEFLEETERALFTLGIASDMIKINKQNQLSLKFHKKQHISLRQFKIKIKKAYASLISESSGLHLQKYYVEIYKVRDLVMNQLGWETHNEFDELFLELITSTYGRDINIHGAAPQWFTEKGLELEDIAFRYERKVYIFMSMKR